ncbi:hypothetical protein [Leifsonia aquatica]|uniref:hypothetical protein n=1 Tax=Leifsonia aquatica TaxID=144185 RepID=UPI000469E5A3|nr:hypothetical protein [Leifsonia aquatica]
MNDVTPKEIDLAASLLRRAEADQHAAHRLGGADDVSAIRREVRRRARANGTRIRTGIVDGTLVVILADADLWAESAAVMREKLRPPD